GYDPADVRLDSCQLVERMSDPGRHQPSLPGFAVREQNGAASERIVDRCTAMADGGGVHHCSQRCVALLLVACRHAGDLGASALPQASATSTTKIIRSVVMEILSSEYPRRRPRLHRGLDRLIVRAPL